MCDTVTHPESSNPLLTFDVITITTTWLVRTRLGSRIHSSSAPHTYFFYSLTHHLLKKLIFLVLITYLPLHSHPESWPIVGGTGKVEPLGLPREKTSAGIPSALRPGDETASNSLTLHRPVQYCYLHMGATRAREGLLTQQLSRYTLFHTMIHWDMFAS